MYVCRACARRGRTAASSAVTGSRVVGSERLRSTWTGRRTTATRPTTVPTPLRTLPGSPTAVQIAPLSWHRMATTRAHASSLPVDAPPPGLFDETETEARAAAASPAGKNNAARLDAVVRRRLKFLKDPYTIGKGVEESLAKGDYEEALQLTRTASKHHQVVVSWNHLIGYMMRTEKLTAAIKLYNEMKKRGQLPNAQTYTIIFRGCAKSPHASLAVYQATRLYYAMLGSERIKPNTIHMNAVLQVCARAKDIESLFSVAKTANHGLRAPNTLTYTTVLNGLRYTTARPHHRAVAVGGGGGDGDGGGAAADADEEAVHADREKVSVSIARARAVWEEVVANWREGRILVDEELVCAMGRVLLMGGYYDNDDVLSLVEQTMGIPRLDRAAAVPAAAKDGEDGKEGNEPIDRASTPAAAPAAPDAPAGSVAAPPPAHVRPTQFAPLPPGLVAGVAAADDRRHDGGSASHALVSRSSSSVVTSASNVLYARPGRNVLSLVLTSLGATRKTSLAARYWDVFTQAPHGVVPDSENWYRLLKALRRGHASTKTVEVLQQMPAGLMDERTFRLAMATCAADNLNDRVFASAGKVLDLMNRTLRVPDAHTMRLYLQTAMTNNRRYRDQLKELRQQQQQEEEAAAAAAEKDKRDKKGRPWSQAPAPQQQQFRANSGAAAARAAAAKFAFGQQIVRALWRLWDPLRRASNALSYPGSGADKADKADKAGEAYNARRELAALARQMVSAADMVVTEGMADEATLKDLRTSRNLLNRQITRFYERREEMEPNLKRGRRGRQEGGKKGEAKGERETKDGGAGD